MNILRNLFRKKNRKIYIKKPTEVVEEEKKPSPYDVEVKKVHVKKIKIRD